MRTGLELISAERINQLKHHSSIKEDVDFNCYAQLSVAAGIIGQKDIPESVKLNLIPIGWNAERWNRLLNKSYKERLAIAGALYAAELDRLNYIELKELMEKVV